MNKEKQDIVPELRFPSFSLSKGWKQIQLIDVTDKNEKWSFIGGPFGSSLKSSDYVNSSHGVRIIQLQNIGDSKFHNDYKIYTSEEKADELLSCNIYQGDIIISKMGDPVGRACIIPNFHDRYVMCSDGIRVVVDESKYSKYFIYLMINSDFFRKNIEKTATGSTRKRIGLSALKKLMLFVPEKINEQQKIADCLSSLDELIEAESEKLESLKEHKKGLLQQLFPAEGQSVPKLRFPEFENDGEWEETTLGNVGTFINGRAYKQDELLSAGKYRVLRVGNFFTNKEWYYSNLELGENKYCEKGDLLYAWSASFGPRIWHEEKAIYHYHIWKVIEKEEIDRDFLFELLDYETERIKAAQANGLGILHITKSGVESWECLIPPTRGEQIKIAEILSNSQKVILAQTEKNNSLKEHKKGLMQQLFPNLNEQKS